MKAKDVRRGQVIKYKGNLCSVIDFHHHTPGNLRALVQLKLRNLITGAQIENKFGPAEDLETADVFNQPATFLYSDHEGFHFMNEETYEQVTMTEDQLGDSRFYLQEEMKLQLAMFEENPIGISLPTTVTLTIVDTEPGMKGATATNSPKPAKTNTGLALSVPQFVNIGDKVIVNTESGEYQSRA
jgi:elongation factor P